MGTAISRARDAYYSVQAVVGELTASNASFATVLARISSSPGLPVLHPTRPFWLRDPPFPALVGAQSESLPPAADVLIIGSGITAAGTAWAILRDGEGEGPGEGDGESAGRRKLVVLDARDTCSGATGRNGGHIKISLYELFSALRERLGAARAREIVTFQMSHVRLLVDLAATHGWAAAEAREVETIDLFLDAEGWGEAKCMVDELRAGMPDIAGEVRVWEGKEAREKFKMGSHVLGAISYSAGVVWPYRLVTCIFSTLLRNYPRSFSLETNTPVSSISIDLTTPAMPFVVHTPRGTIRARHIVHASNGHSAALIPGLRAKLLPVRGQVTAQRPGPAFPHTDGSRSWSASVGKSLLYMTQIPGRGSEDSKGVLVLGGAFAHAAHCGMDEVGVADDARLNYDVGAYLGGALPLLFGGAHWGGDTDTDAGESRVLAMWTGIMGFTTDRLPFVGRLEERVTGRQVAGDDVRGSAPGEWIAAGYNGEGMVNAWLCGVAVGLMAVGKDEVDYSPVVGDGRKAGPVRDWLPREYLISWRRLQRASVYELATLL